MLGKSLKNVEAAGNFAKPVPGGYVMRIDKVNNITTKEKYEIYLDYTDGDLKDYNKGINDRFGFWPSRVTRSYSDNALGFFKTFIETVVASNDNVDGLIIGDYEDIDEDKLVGKLIGVVIGEREYDGNDGTRKRGLDWYKAEFIPVEDIRNENYTVPELRVAETAKTEQPQSTGVVDMSANFGPVSNADIPF